MLHEAARQYIGVPFEHQGRDPSRAIDCLGLLVVCALDCGWDDVLAHDLKGYSRAPHHGLLEQRLEAAFGPPVSDMQPGDILAMRGRHGRSVRHVGIVGDHAHGLSVIHTDAHLGRVIEHRIDSKAAAQIAHVYRRTA